MIKELFVQYHTELLRWCQGMTGDPHNAEEIVSEAYLRAMLHENQLKPLGERQRRAWLYRVCKNLYIDRLRHQSFEFCASELPESPAVPEEISFAEWDDVLRSLPGLEGTFFSMRYLQGYTSGQIGEMFSLPPGTVRSMLSSARKHLKKELGGKNHA